jgi:hypothetical protein
MYAVQLLVDHYPAPTLPEGAVEAFMADVLIAAVSLIANRTAHTRILDVDPEHGWLAHPSPRRLPVAGSNADRRSPSHQTPKWSE